MGANNFDSNIERKLAKKFIDKFESMRVLSKNVNTQFLSNAFNPSTGDKVDIKRPTDYLAVETAKGDISGGDRSEIITGKATGTVQPYITVSVDYDEADEAIRMDQLDQLLDPMARRIVTQLELNFAKFMMVNTALLSGTVGTPVTTWDHVAAAGSILSATGVPMDSSWHFSVNPFTQTKLAGEQRSLGAGGRMGDQIADANMKAVIAENFAGLDVRTATTLANYTSGAGADRVGTIANNPDVTYLAAKDSMTQSIDITGFDAVLPIKAGETIQISGRNRLNLSTRELILNDTGNEILFTATVVADVTLVAGAGTIVVTGPAIFETGSGKGAYNTVDSAPIAGDVITLLGAATQVIQPNLFWHKQAFAIGSVPIKKLSSTDTLATTEDGLQIRISKGVDFLANKQIVRFDFRPAFSALNPFFAGKAFG